MWFVKIVFQCSWLVCNFFGWSCVIVVDVVKIGVIYVVMLVVMIMVLFIWVLMGCKCDVLNMGFNLWMDFVLVLVGLKFDVEGEEYLWFYWFVVFIFNYQSLFDVLVIVKLLNKDFMGIGKKEIVSFFIVGFVF